MTKNEETMAKDDWIPQGIFHFHFSSHIGSNISNGSSTWTSAMPYFSVALTGSNTQERPSSSSDIPNKRRKFERRGDKRKNDSDSGLTGVYASPRGLVTHLDSDAPAPPQINCQIVPFQKSEFRFVFLVFLFWV